MALSRAQILAADDLPKMEVPVPEWGGSVFVRMLNFTERLALEAAIKAAERDAVFTVIAATACDESGALLFTADDVEALKKKQPFAVVAVMLAARKLNRLSKEDIEDLQGNSEASRSEDSPFGSQDILA